MEWSRHREAANAVVPSGCSDSVFARPRAHTQRADLDTSLAGTSQNAQIVDVGGLMASGTRLWRQRDNSIVLREFPKSPVGGSRYPRRFRSAIASDLGEAEPAFDKVRASLEQELAEIDRKAKWLLGETEDGRGSQRVSHRLYELETREQVVKSQLALAKGLDVVELHPPGSRELCGQGGGDPCGLRAETRPDTRPSPSCASVSPRAPNTDMQG